MIQVMQPSDRREDPRHCDGGASLLHMALGLFGERVLCVWEKNAHEPREMKQRCGDAYISNPGAVEHQVVHRDVEEPLGSEPPLLDWLLGPVQSSGAVSLSCVFRKTAARRRPLNLSRPSRQLLRLSRAGWSRPLCASRAKRIARLVCNAAMEALQPKDRQMGSNADAPPKRLAAREALFF